MDPRPNCGPPGLVLPSLEATESLGRFLAGLLRAGDCLLLDGPLGAGKTALARALLRAASGDPALEVPSPSYTLVQSYQGRAGLPIAHFDLWRLDGPDALHELGWDEARDGVVLVEWPDRLGRLTPDDALHIGLSLLPAATPDPDGDQPRQAILSGWPDRIAGTMAAQA